MSTAAYDLLIDLTWVLEVAGLSLGVLGLAIAVRVGTRGGDR